MRFNKELYLVILEIFLYFTLVPNESRKLDGYKFPVYSTQFCPRNESEWNKRSSTLNCNKTNGYTCLPNQQFTELLEFCYTQPRILIEKGTCLYLVERVSKVNGHNCHHFRYGCHNTAFLSDRIFEYPACISLGHGCFLAEPSCESGNLIENTSTNVKENLSILLGIIIPICVLIVIMCGCYVFYKKTQKFQICQRHSDVESSGVEKLTQFKELHELNDIDLIDEKYPLFQQKRTFESNEEIETLIYDNQRVGENSEYHKVEILSPFVEKNKNMAYQGFQVCTRNSEESLNLITSVQSFENYKLDIASIEEVCRSYQRKNALDCGKKEQINLCSDQNQHIGGNAENHEGEIQTFPIKNNTNITYQGFQVCTRNSEESLNLITSVQTFENYKLGTASIEEVCRIYQRKNALDCGKKEQINLCFDQNKHIGGNAENHEGEIQTFPIKNNISYQETFIEKAVFDNWDHDDSRFIFTRACKEVERMIKTKHLVVVTGHSGSGKSAIIQHIALQYRKQGWTVRRIKEVKDIVDEYSSSRFQKNKTVCVFNDPFGKESFDEMLNNSWQTYEEELKSYLKSAKLIMSCRNFIIYDTRVKRNLICESDIVDVDSDKNKLSVNEKRQILKQYTSDMYLSNEECNKIVEVEKYFPLLCKLYFNKHDNAFSTEPIKVLEKEIRGFRKKDKEKYCALVLLVLFKNALCVNCLLENERLEKKYKHTLKLCGLPESTPPSAISDSLELLLGFFVKKIGDTYHFHHDFVMEVTTHVLGTDYPVDLIKYADIGFLRRKVKLGNCNEKNDAFLIHLSDRHVEELAKRLFTEMIGPRFLDVVLNPCLRNEKVNKALREIMNIYQVRLEMVLKNKKLNKLDKEVLESTSKGLLLSKLSFLESQIEVSPLFALIVFCHTELSMHCLHTLGQTQANIDHSSLFPAVCCNGSLSMFETFTKDSMTIIWHGVHPIHLVSVFHNYEILNKLIEKGENVNRKIDAYRGWTPLMLASGNDCKENEINNHGISSETRRNETVEVLLKNGADINISCTEHRDGPLFLACQNGYDSTVNLLLSKKPNVNACTNDGSSPLYIACQNGHDRTVLLLLSNGADINLCKENRSSPLLIACKNGHDSTVQVLLSNGADINLCTVDGASPLYKSCLNGHDAIAKLLLSYGADINMCIKDEFSALFAACLRGHESTVKLLLRNGAKINLCKNGLYSPLIGACFSGQENIFNILLRNGADINLCNEYGDSPLYLACLLGHDNTIKFLLSNGAIVNLCKNNGTSPLSAACFAGHDSTVQLLLKNKADINLCSKHGTSPLYRACYGGHCSIVQLLLSNGADTSLCCIDGFSPLFAACQKGYNSIVELLLSNGADINLCSKDDSSPLYAACQNGHDSTAQLLLSNGAEINLCKNKSPLYAACCNGHFEVVQLLLSEGADMNLCSEDGASPLYASCINRHDSIVHLLVNKGADVNLYTEEKASPLFAACITGHHDNVQTLLNKGADVNICNKNGIYPLHIACFNSQESTVQMLLANRAGVNVCMQNGISPLHIACEKGNISIVQLLMTEGADINVCREDVMSPLIAAYLSKQYHIIQLLLQNGADTNSCFKNVTSPLYLACANGQDETAQLLLKNGANINSCAKDGSSPLFVASLNGHTSTVQVLLGNGADINICNKNGNSPLYAACFSGHEDTAQLLLNNGANINEGTGNGGSPLHWACCCGNNAIVQLLLRNGANINSCMERKASPVCSKCYMKHDSIPSPLRIACLHGQYSTAQLLISKGADVNLCLEDGISPLYEACKNKNDSIVQLLLRKGANVNLFRRDGCSPLHEACKIGHDITVQLLLSNGAEVNLCRQYIVSPLFIACFHGYNRIIQLLLSKGADINLCIKNGTCSLCIACYNGHEKTVKLLMSNGADINLCREGAPSPLFAACENRHDIIVQLLLRNGANINLCNRNMLSPLYIASQNGHESTVKLLLRKDAHINLCLTNGISPLYTACNNGHDDIIQLLLRNGADINLCMNDRVSPLYIAFECRCYKTVNILLNNGAVDSLDCGWEVNPDLVGCFDENDSTVKFLRQPDNVLCNMYDLDSYFSLFVWCQVERVTRMIFDK